MHMAKVSNWDGETFMAKTLGRIDLSSWISWACYAVGFFIAAAPSAVDELRSGGTGVVLMIVAVLGFFVATALIQQHMQLSLRASTFGHPKRLVTNGVFRYSRNPIYVAFLLPLVSLAYLSPLAALVSCLLYLLLMTFFVIMPEERVLSAEFGEAYQDYRARVPRWFGRF